MRQLNVALNRDIFRLKKGVLISDDIDLDKNIHSEYPNLEIYFDLMNDFKSLLDQNSDQFFNSSKIFLIDPYGRAVMYFDDELDPKLIKRFEGAHMNVRNISLAGVIFAFVVIALGAWTRLVDAGLGCPAGQGAMDLFFPTNMTGMLLLKADTHYSPMK